MLSELIDGLQVAVTGRGSNGGGGSKRGKAPGLPNPGDLREMIEKARRGELLRLTLGEDRWRLVEQMQAAMSLIEGHAEHTMDAVGAEILPSLPRLRAAMTRRRESRGLPWRVLERLLGLELKMRQYEIGRRFCDAVVREGGPQALARAWTGPDALPSTAELRAPAQWLARTSAPAQAAP
jgi:putative hydrolase